MIIQNSDAHTHAHTHTHICIYTNLSHHSFIYVCFWGFESVLLGVCVYMSALLKCERRLFILLIFCSVRPQTQ